MGWSMENFVENYRQTLNSLRELVVFFTENHNALNHLPAWVWDKQNGVDFDKFKSVIDAAKRDIEKIESRYINVKEHVFLAMNPARRLMVMIAKLHELGYQKIRFYPHIGGAGYWRYIITISPAPPIFSKDVEPSAIQTVWNSLGSGDQPYGWGDTFDDSIEELALKFLRKYPLFAEEGKGSDSEYVKWYSNMIEKTRPGGIIYLWWDGSYEDEKNNIGIMNSGRRRIKIPYPPDYRKILGHIEHL